MKKIFMLLISIMLLTGCTATYDINITKDTINDKIMKYKQCLALSVLYITLNVVKNKTINQTIKKHTKKTTNPYIIFAANVVEI